MIMSGLNRLCRKIGGKNTITSIGIFRNFIFTARNKVDKSNVFESFYDDAGKAPMIKECPVNYLCKVIQTIPIFDFTMFLGEIVAVYANEVCLENDRPDALKIKPIVMMDAGYFDLNERIGSAFKAGADYHTS
jgi:flavin reductase (DIM6/NTAB) family NADH-FMN oxidoreductase RutF